MSHVADGVSRRALAEFVGSAFLVATVVGSGIAAQRSSPHDTGLQLLENSVATGAVLVALILSLQSVSAAFNPLVSLMERLTGRIDTAQLLASIGAQFAGCAAGALLANLMFGLDAVTVSTHRRSASGQWLAEVVATIGLLVVVFGTVHSGRGHRVAYAVGGYIAAAYWFTSSTSFANPAVTVARMLSDTFAGIAPSSVAMFVLMQVIGALIAFALLTALFPQVRPTEAVAV